MRTQLQLEQDLEIVLENQEALGIHMSGLDKRTKHYKDLKDQYTLLKEEQSQLEDALESLNRLNIVFVDFVNKCKAS